MTADALPRINRPCDECPWRTTAQPGRFTPERWASLAATSRTADGSAPLGSPIFACHKTSEGADRACAGWLAVEGWDHVGIRLAVAQGRVPVEALYVSEEWPPLFGSLAEAAAHDLGGNR